MSIGHRSAGRLRRNLTRSCIAFAVLLQLMSVSMTSHVSAQQPAQPATRRSISERHLDPSGFPWPSGAKAALSLTFDDGRSSQVTHAVPVLDSFAVKATFYAQPKNLLEELERWQHAIASGHEIGNHTVGTRARGISPGSGTMVSCSSPTTSTACVPRSCRPMMSWKSSWAPAP
ncbi:MAG: hypothetical protein CME04_03995 [Gemmatimonadaceae bacterium]|jgi:hypothetical protein|nr:hypothetical protein [Gemmatimonadaceae bacterium]